MLSRAALVHSCSKVKALEVEEHAAKKSENE